jgi:hypothetical protein
MDRNLIRFGYIARQSQLGGGGYFIRSNVFYLPSLLLEEGRRGSAPCVVVHYIYYRTVNINVIA